MNFHDPPQGMAPDSLKPLCALEPIHTPGSIQPHGALLAICAETRRITHASANLASVLAIAADAALGRLLDDVIGASAADALLGEGPLLVSRVHTMPGPNGEPLHLHAFAAGTRVGIDIEPLHPVSGHEPDITQLQTVLESFKQATGCSELCRLAVKGLREITGYDRVMAYRFAPDGHGEVIAEACDDGLEPYLGLHYPAGDLPPQARRQYVRQRVGAIADSAYEPVPLLRAVAFDDGAPVDLTHSTLRSASPVHRKYMRNMRTAASLTIGLAHGQKLWGMLVCHHGRPHIAGPTLRAVADVIGQVVSLLLASLGEAEAYQQRLERNNALDALVERLGAPLPLAEAFAAAEVEMLDLVGAAGALVRLGEATCRLGRTPPEAAALHALDRLLPEIDGPCGGVDDLGLRYPELADCIRDGSGALLLKLGETGHDAVLWFRPELPQIVSWGGNPADQVTQDPMTGQLSPRASFDVWKETVRGRSSPWIEADLGVARELRNAVAAQQAQRSRTEITRLRNDFADEQRVQNARFRAALENMGDGLAMFDASEKLVVCNARYGQIYNLPAELQRVGTPFRDIIAYRIRHGIMAGETSEAAIASKLAALGEVSRQAGSQRIEELADGRLISVTRQPVEGGGWVGTHEDVTDRHRHDARISFMAHHDLLTGLHNRASFAERLEEAVARLRRHGEPFAVFMLDLDRFKSVNDTLGHPAGDKLLQETAQRLKASLRETDVLARLGGDEFALLQIGEKQPRDGATRLAARLAEIICRPYDLGSNIVTVGTSIGVALAPTDSSDAGELMKMADLALYAAKSEGRNRYRFFDPAMLAETDRRRRLEIELLDAIERQEFELHYQPIIGAQDGTPSGFEALVRWHHPTRGLVFPNDFIPFAEESGLIVPIGEWVLQRACADAATWPEPMRVSVNLSPAQLASPDLLDVILCALVEADLAPNRLEIEVTETALFKSDVDYASLFRQLKNLGVSIALDDFGTGYSSLSYVTMFPFDKIKIDKSFTLNLTKRSDCAAIVSAVLALGKGIDAKTVAEGVETEEQLAILKTNGVDFVQGNFFGRPCPHADLCPEPGAPACRGASPLPPRCR